MKDLIEFMVKALVDDPSEVSITEIEGDKITLDRKSTRLNSSHL